MGSEEPPAPDSNRQGIREIDRARERAETDAAAIKHRVRYAELLRLAGRLEESAEAYRVAARAYVGQGDWYRAFAIGRALLFLDPEDTETQRYINAAYSRHRDGLVSATESRDTSLISGVIDAPLPQAMSGKRRFPLETSRLAELAELPVLSDVTAEQIEDIAHYLRTVVVSRGETIFREGEMSDGMFVVLRGDVSVEVVDDIGQVVELTQLSRGGFFGEFAVLGTPLRTALVTAATRVELLDIDRELFEMLTERSAEFRDAVHREWETRERQNAFARISLLSHMPADRRGSIIHPLGRVPVRARELIVRQGDPPDRIALLVSGRVEAYERDEAGEKVVRARVGGGNLLPDPGLAEGRPYVCHIRATEPCVVLWLSRSLLVDAIGREPEQLDLIRRALSLAPETEPVSLDEATLPGMKDSYDDDRR